MIYTFIGDFGVLRYSYPEYLQDESLRKWVNDSDRKRLFLGSTILTYTEEFLAKNPDKAELYRNMETMFSENPLMFFLPNGEGVQFLNDLEHTVKGLIAPNRVGKTATVIVDLLLDAIPMDPNAPIFKLHGVRYRPWRGPLQCGYASSTWSIMQRVIWPEIKKWIPKYELGEYDTSKPGGKDLSWHSNPHLKLTCGTELFLLCYEQEQPQFESQVFGRFCWDEQGQEAKFDGADERLRTVRGGRHIFGLTPHKIEGRPDTGARSWIHAMAMGKKTKGHKCKFYKISVEDVPDWIYPETSKQQAYEKHVLEPKRTGNTKDQKEGRARFYGEWHDTAGLVYDEWDDAIHLIDPFEIPSEWTRYRAIDHGDVNPTACIWAAISPSGDIYLYQEYYRAGPTIFENARNIVEASGNTLSTVGTMERHGGGIFCRRYMEDIVKQRFKATVLDSRSFTSHDPFMGMTQGKLYQLGGLHVTPASGVSTHLAIPIVKQLLHVDPDKAHPITKKKGSPRLFVFRTLECFRRELGQFANSEFRSYKAAENKNPTEKPKNKNDHLMDCVLYLVQIPPRYIEGTWAFKNAMDAKAKHEPTEEELEDRIIKPSRRRDAITGY